MTIFIPYKVVALMILSAPLHAEESDYGRACLDKKTQDWVANAPEEFQEAVVEVCLEARLFRLTKEAHPLAGGYHKGDLGYPGFINVMRARLYGIRWPYDDDWGKP